MPMLPIQARVPDRWASSSPQSLARSAAKSSGDVVEASSNSPGVDSVRLIVKRTFFEVEDPEEERSQRSSFHERGAQTCTSRLSEPTPSTMLLDCPRESDDEAVRRLCDEAFEGPPNNEAPSSFKEADMIPPPSEQPGEQVARELFLNSSSSCGGFDSSPDTAGKISVKNTFIHIPDDDTSPVNARLVQSCTAKMSMSRQDASELLTTPMGVDATTMQTPTIVITPVPPIVADTKAAIATAVGVSDVSTPTPGSLLHGLLDDEGRLIRRDGRRLLCPDYADLVPEHVRVMKHPRSKHLPTIQSYLSRRLI